MAKQILRQAPYLRRYARALTGSQAEGDALVQATMEGLLNSDVALDEEAPMRIALYRALNQIWRRMAPDFVDSDAGTSGGEGLYGADPDRPQASDANGADGAAETEPDRRLQELSPEDRAALLLTAMEGFSPAEAAQALGVTPEALDRRLADAQAAVQRQLATDVLIVEDEPIIGLDLTRLARELGHRVTGVAATRTEAVEMARKAAPGLVLADVRLADGSNGMDAAADIRADLDVPVIFITAFPEHLLTGDRPEPTFMITKPFREETVKALIGQALFFHRPAVAATAA